MNKIKNRDESSDSKSQKSLFQGDIPPNTEKNEGENNLNSMKKSKSKTIRVYTVMTVCILIFAGLMFIFHSSLIRKTPYDRVLRATLKGFRQKSFNTETHLSCNFLPDPQGREMVKHLVPYGEEGQFDFLSEVMPKFQFVVSANGDFKSNSPYFGYDISILYDNKDIIDFGCFIEDCKLGLLSKSILNKPLVVNFKNLPNNRLSQIKYSEYIDILLDYGNPFIMSLNSSEYADILRDSLKDRIKVYEVKPRESLKIGKNTYDVENFILDITYEQLYELYDRILQRASVDSKLQDFVISKVDALCDKVIENQDYDLFSMDKDEFREFKKELEESIISSWKPKFTKLISELSTQKNTLGDKIDEKIPEYLFSIDEKSNLRKLSLVLDIEGVKVKKVSYYKDNKDGMFDFDNKNNRDITDIVASPDKLLGLTVGIGHNIVANVIKGENFNYMVNDITSKSSVMDDEGKKFVHDKIDSDIRYIENSVYLMEAFLSVGLNPNLRTEQSGE